MIKKYIKILLISFFYINLNIFNCYSAEKELENRYFTMSLKNYIINCTEKLSSRIDNNDFTDGNLDIKKINEDIDISKILENDEGDLKFSPTKNKTVKKFLEDCSNIYWDDEYYKLFNDVFNEKENENNQRYKIANIFLKLLIIELDYERKTNKTFQKYIDDNSENFKKTRGNNKDFFDKYYGAKFFCERAKSLIIINKSLLNSIKLMIKHYKDKNKNKILEFIISQTYNKMLNIDYLWILYTYGYRASKTFSNNDPGFAPFPATIFKDNYF